MKYVFIDNGVVADLTRIDPFLIFSSDYAARFIDAPDEVEGGWLYDGQFFTSPPPPAPIFPRFVGNEKLDLFTPPEQLAVVTATMTDPVIKLTYDRLINAAYLSYEDPEVELGLTMLQSRGLITPDRKAEIVMLMHPA